MKNQTNSSIEVNYEAHFQCYVNILCNDTWEILEYSMPLDELNELEVKLLIKVIERKLDERANRTN